MKLMIWWIGEKKKLNELFKTYEERRNAMKGEEYGGIDMELPKPLRNMLLKPFMQCVLYRIILWKL